MIAVPKGLHQSAGLIPLVLRTPPSLPNRVSLHPPAPKTEWGFGPLAPSQPARSTPHLQVPGSEPADTSSSSGWRGAGEAMAAPSLGADTCITCGRPGSRGQSGVGWGRRKTQEEKRESGEKARELGAGSAPSLTSGGGQCGTGSGRFRRGAGGGHGRSPAATSSPLAAPPPHPATALQVRLLTLKSCRSDEPPPAPSSSQLSRALHLPFPRHPPHTHTPWVREPRLRDRLRAGARGLPSLKSPGESPRGRREKPAPPQPGPRPAPPPACPAGLPFPLPGLPLGVVPSLPPESPSSLHVPAPTPASSRAVSSKHGKIRNKK